MKKEAFKKFVNLHPILINYVKNHQMTWQQFYEIYDLYGEDNSIWDNFFQDDSKSSSNLTGTIKEIIGLFKGVDLKSIQKTLTSLDKAIDAFKGVSTNNNTNMEYSERPKYKYFED